MFFDASNFAKLIIFIAIFCNLVTRLMYLLSNCPQICIPYDNTEEKIAWYISFKVFCGTKCLTLDRIPLMRESLAAKISH